MSNTALKKVTTEQNEQARKNIIEVFKTSGMSKKKFCDLYLAGAAEKTIYSWEVGKALPRKSTIKLLSDTTGIPIAALYKESLSADQINNYMVSGTKEQVINSNINVSDQQRTLEKNHIVYKKMMIKTFQKLSHNDQHFACSYFIKLLQYEEISVADHVISKKMGEKFAAICELMTPGMLELACCLILHLKKNTAGIK